MKSGISMRKQQRLAQSKHQSALISVAIFALKMTWLSAFINNVMAMASIWQLM